MGLSASLEDYLEAVLLLARQHRVVRVRDIAGRVGVRMPSVNTALKRLAEQGLVTHEPYEFVDLTEAGRAAAEGIHRRHETLRRFLTDVLSIPDEIAQEDACKMEHGMHPQTVTQLRRFLAFLEARAGDLAPCVQALRQPPSEPASVPGAQESETDD